MIGIYLLVTIFTQLSPNDLIFASLNGPAQVSVKFERIPGIKVGSPVLNEGQLIGTVMSINRAATNRKENAAAKAGQKEQPCSLKVQIEPRHRSLLRKGTIALIASPLSNARVQTAPVVELLVPVINAPALQEGEVIRGYASYEEFWSAGLVRKQA